MKTLKQMSSLKTVKLNFEGTKMTKQMADRIKKYLGSRKSIQNSIITSSGLRSSKNCLFYLSFFGVVLSFFLVHLVRYKFKSRLGLPQSKVVLRLLPTFR